MLYFGTNFISDMRNIIIQEELVIWQMVAKRHLNSTPPIIRPRKESGNIITRWPVIW